MARSRIIWAARTARSASSSWAWGSPNTAMTASPTYFSARPRSDSSSAVTRLKKAATTSRKRSGSRSDASRVDPTMSANMIVTTLRSAVVAEPTGVPHRGQNRAPGGSGAPQRAQVRGVRGASSIWKKHTEER